MIFVPDIIGDIIDTMRETGTFASVVDNGDGTFTINASNSMEPLEWVNIAGTDYKVIESTSNDFKIEATAIAAPGSYKALAPYYLFGHRLDIDRRLTEKDKDSIFMFQKYPLIALRLPIIQDINETDVNEISANMAVFGFTDKNFTSEERYENVIKPVLHPLYEQLLEALRNSSYISGLGTLPHRRVDRLFWGTETKEGNVKYLFSDPLDAIELIDLKLNILDLNC